MICARSEVGLSRLPVTEEIAGSNPVERATDIFTLIGCFFMENIPFLLHFCTICVMISPIGLEGLRSFYNKIPDNVRGRIPSVMVRNREQFNPSDSKLPKKIIALIGAAAFAFGVAGCNNSESYSKPTPDTTTSTSHESESPSPEPSPEVSASSCTKFEGDQELLTDLKLAKTDGEKRNAFVEFARKQTDEPMAETNSMGTTVTSQANLVDTINQLGRDSVTTLESSLNLVADGCFNDSDKKFISDSFLSSATLGQATMSLGRAFDNAIEFSHNDKVIEDLKNEVSCKIIHTAKAEERNGVEQPTFVTRNNLNVSKDVEKKDPLRDTSLEGSFYVSQIACQTENKSLITEHLTIVHVSSDEDPVDSLENGKQATKMINPSLSPGDITNNEPRYASWTILTDRGVNPDSQIPTLYNGVATTLGEVPAVKEALAEREEVRANK